jgi:GNAT superfamily N-acetyltransferase
MDGVGDEKDSNNEIDIRVAQADELEIVLGLVEELLAELGDEGQEFAGIDRVKLRADLERERGRFQALLARDVSGRPIGVLTLSTGFALYAGGQYGVIDEVYVRPECRDREVGRRMVEAAVDIAREQHWFRLDVTGPVGAVGAGQAEAAGPGTGADRVVRFYEDLGFEFTGPKLRLLVDNAGLGSMERTGA